MMDFKTWNDRLAQDLKHTVAWSHVQIMKVDQPLVLDIGSNTGMFSYMLSIVQPDARFYMFEPVAKYAQMSRKFLGRKEDQFYVFELGLGVEDGQGHIFVSDTENWGWNTMAKYSRKNMTEQRCTLARLDTWVDLLGNDRFDLIKIDVEGFESRVLAGGHKTIESSKCPIVVEVGDGLNNPYIDDLMKEFDWLKSIGYGIPPIRGEKTQDLFLRFQGKR